MTDTDTDFIFPVADASNVSDEILLAKLADAETPGFEVDFDPDEAERVGAFLEDALTEEEARESTIDLADQGVA